MNGSRGRLARAARGAAQRLQQLGIEDRIAAALARLRAVLPGGNGRARLPYHVDDYHEPPQRQAPRQQPGRPVQKRPAQQRAAQPYQTPRPASAPRQRRIQRAPRFDISALMGALADLRARLPQLPRLRLPGPAGVPALARRRPASTRQQPETSDPTRAGGAVQSERRSEWLTAHGLEKAFGGRSVVSGVSLGLRRGEVVGLLGPNGAGKTTTFYMITGLIGADAGAIELDGFDITHLPMYRRARLGVGYLPQEPSIFRGMTVEENIMAVLELVEPDRATRARQLDSLLAEFSITRLRKSPAIALSGGERRRVEIARALASRPVFMLLDEPFAGIDPIAVNDIRSLVRHLTTRGIGVLITDHNVRETLSLIDRAYIIHDGRVLMEGTPEAVVANDAVRRFYLGEDFTL